MHGCLEKKKLVTYVSLVNYFVESDPVPPARVNSEASNRLNRTRQIRYLAKNLVVASLKEYGKVKFTVQ